MHKDTKWAKQIISLQDKEGKWGYFHTLYGDSKSSYTTETALRRLEVLGYTIEDDCIQKAVSYMNDCLTGVKEIPDKREKLHDWDIFTSLILASWIRRFTKDYAVANSVAEKWAEIISIAFKGEEYDHQAYIKAYHHIFGMKPKGGRMVDFVQFYILSIINGCIDKETEQKVLSYIINKPDGVYYTYDKCIKVSPDDFESKDASLYLGSIELLAEYETAKDHLQFVVDWLKANKNENGKWDMGKDSKDGIYLPLSNDWRKQETRESDCTERITKLLNKISL